MVLGIGGVLGICVGGGLAYAVDSVDRTFRNPDEVRHALGLPLVGDVPDLHSLKHESTVSEGGETTHKIHAAVVTYHRPRSREAEAIRGLRTAIYFGTRQNGQKVIQLTSPNPGDGKTTIAANLAVSLAQSGKRVLLIDADLRHPSQGRLFGFDSNVGLSDLIVGDVELPDAVQSVGIDNLSILPCGTRPPNPSELLTSPVFEQILDVARQQYDYVLVDSPPLLAVSDPSVIAPRVDGVLLTIRVTKNGAPAAVQARRMLAALGAKVIGIVVNGFQHDRNFGYGYYGGRYGYTRGYGYGYGYGRGYGYGDSRTNGDYYSDDDHQKSAIPVASAPRNNGAPSTVD